MKTQINLGKKYSRIKSLAKKNKKILSCLSKRQNLKLMSIDDIAASHKLSLRRSQSRCRIKNRCMLTNKARGYIGAFRASRISLRAVFANANAPGIVKV